MDLATTLVNLRFFLKGFREGYRYSATCLVPAGAPRPRIVRRAAGVVSGTLAGGAA